MGKKGTKRKTRWRALPLGEEDGGSGNEEELLDEDQSTTSSVVGQAPSSFRASPAMFRTAEKPYRQARRFPYDKFRHKEPLIKLENKTFDEEEYTKITTPRQDVLFKKGYFGRKKESSIEENVYNNTNEVEGEEPLMDQIIITNGFVDERGHYLVNGSSYEIYDPYTNTVTVVVGPPPYANGVTPPVLAAVSCQPVPLQPVDWYPPGNEWSPQGPAWTPTYHQNPPHSADSVSSPVQSCESTPTSQGSEGPMPNLYHHPAYVPMPHPSFVYEPPIYNNANGGIHQDSVNQTTEVMCSNDNLKLKKTRRKSQETANENELESNHIGENLNNSQITAIETSNQDSNSSLERVEDNKEEQNGLQTPSTNGEEKDSAPGEAKHVEKQSHSTQTNLLEAQKILEKSAGARVKESHSTQTNPDETFPNNNNVNKNNVNVNHNNKLDTAKLKEMERNETNRSLSDILLSSLTKKDQEPKVPWKTVNKFQRTSPRKPQEESPKKIYQKRTNFNERNENKQIPSVETSPVKTSYAKKVMNGLENGSIQGNNNNNNHYYSNNKKLMVNGSNTVMNGSSQFAQNVNVNKPPLTNGTKQGSIEKNNYTEYKRSNGKVSGNVNNNNKNYNNNYYEKQRFHRSLSNGKSAAAQKERKIQEKPEKCLEISSESRSQSEKSSTVSELSSPTELSSGQNTPPEKLIVKKMEQKIANEINKSFEEKLKQNLTKEEEIVVEEAKVEEIKEEETNNHRKQKSSENKKKKNKTKTEEEKAKETPKSNKSKKNKKKQSDESKDAHDYSNQDIPFLQPFIQQKPNEFMFNGWDKVKSQESDLISDIDSLLTANDDNILKSLGISEDKLNLSKLPLNSGFLKMLPTFNRDRPKFKFDDYFASTGTKQLHSDLCTKTNITNMKSTKPEEFFASIIENPESGRGSGNGSSSSSSSNDKKPAKNGKKEEVSNDVETDKKETVKETNHGAQVIVKKSISIPKTGYKINKNNLKCKMNVTESKSEVKEEDVAVKKNEEKPEEVKLGILEAVNSWLQEEGDSEKLLSVNSLPQSFEKLESDEETETEPIQKNGMSNPILALCVDEKKDEDVANANVRVARNGNTKCNNTRRYRSSSLDTKLSEKKIKKFLTESASFCSDLIGDVRNGVSLEYAREELCDPKQSVLKYYTLTPAHTKSKRAEESDSENEVFDVLEYKFQGKRSQNGFGNVSITDSGVHSDTESNEENKKVHNPSERQPFPNKEVCNCKLQ